MELIKRVMSGILRYLSRINPLIFAAVYFFAAMISSILIYILDYFELSTGLTNIDINSFFISLYFSLITISTLGYGDIVPGNDATRVLASGLAFLGVIITGLFLNSLAFKVSILTQIEDKKKLERDQHNADIQKFKNISILLRQNFDDYKYAANSLITPLERYNHKPDISNLLKLNFKVNDMKDLFKANPLRRFPFSKSRIEVYYNVFDILNNNLDELLKLGYFNFNIEIMKNVVNYLSMSKICDSRENILLYAKQNESQKSWIFDMLSTAKDDVKITEIANAIDDYLVLRDQIKLTVSLIISLENLMSSLNS